MLSSYFIFQDLDKLKEFLLVYLFSHFFFCCWKLFLSGDTETQGAILTIISPSVIGVRIVLLPMVQLLKAYLVVHNFDILCLSETHLNSSFPFDDDNLGRPSYIKIRADHPANSKRGGVCMHFKNSHQISDFFTIFYVSVTNYVVSFPFTDHLTNQMILNRF